MTAALAAANLIAGAYELSDLPAQPLDHRRVVVYDLGDTTLLSLVFLPGDEDTPVDAYLDHGNYADGSRTTTSLPFSAVAGVWEALQAREHAATRDTCAWCDGGDNPEQGPVVDGLHADCRPASVRGALATRSDA